MPIAVGRNLEETAEIRGQNRTGGRSAGLPHGAAAGGHAAGAPARSPAPTGRRSGLALSESASGPARSARRAGAVGLSITSGSLGIGVVVDGGHGRTVGAGAHGQRTRLPMRGLGHPAEGQGLGIAGGRGEDVPTRSTGRRRRRPPPPGPRRAPAAGAGFSREPARCSHLRHPRVQLGEEVAVGTRVHHVHEVTTEPGSRRRGTCGLDLQTRVAVAVPEGVGAPAARVLHAGARPHPRAPPACAPP